MTLKNNRAPLPCYFELCVSFHSHLWIQTGVAVQKRLSWVFTSVTLTFELWPLPFARSYCSLSLSHRFICYHQTIHRATHKPCPNPLQPEGSDLSGDEAILLDSFVNEELPGYVDVFVDPILTGMKLKSICYVIKWMTFLYSHTHCCASMEKTLFTHLDN